MKRISQGLLLIVVMLSIVLLVSACTKDDSSTKKDEQVAQTGNDKKEVENKQQEQAKEVELTFPDVFPIPAAVDPSSYDYDDLSQRYEIEIMVAGAFNQPLPDDPIKDYLEEQFNVKLKLTNLSSQDLQNNVAVRFASGDAPDVVMISNKDIALSLFKQGQLAEATDVLKLMPQLAQYVTKTYKEWATVDGDMIGIPRYGTFQDNWGLFLRSDWLDALGMTVPTNEEELYAYAEAVVKQDPDQNGKDDTWFMGTAGGGNSWAMMEPLRTMFGHPDWNVNEEGTINHPMLDGTTRDFLKFVKRLYDNQLLAPDWYTMSWEPFKSYTFNDQIGMVNYPGWNLIDEMYNAKNRDESVLDIWQPIAPLSASDGRGGKYAPGSNPDGLLIFSKDGMADEGKMKRIAHLLDTMIYPNINYWATSQGGGPEIFPDASRVEFYAEDGTNVFHIDKEVHPAYADPQYPGLAAWQSLGYTLLWQVYDDQIGLVGSKHNTFVNDLPRYENYGLFLTLDGSTASKTRDFALRNEIKFVLGERSFDDWDAYVEEWKKTGGQRLMEDAAAQLNAQLP